MGLDLRTDSVTAYGLTELTNWRNHWDFTTSATTGRRIVAELGYLALVASGVAEAVIRFFLLVPILIATCCAGVEMQKWLSGAAAMHCIGNGMLSAIAAISALAALLINPYKIILNNNDLSLCFYPCIAR